MSSYLVTYRLRVETESVRKDWLWPSRALQPARKAEICDDYVVIRVKEEVFEFEIAVSNLLLMDVPDRQHR
jgi:hypothetical protein